MTTAAWISLLIAWGVMVASPGLDFVAVLRSGAAYGRRDALWVALGVNTGVLCWLVLALTGISVLIAAHAGVYQVLRVVGAIFLAGYGLLILWRARKATPQPAATESRDEATPAATLTPGSAGPVPNPAGLLPGSAAPSRQRSWFAAYRLGLLTNLANPKALVFFGALLATLLPASATAVTKLEVAATMIAISLSWFALTACLAGSGVVVRFYNRAKRGVDAVLGTVFVGLAGALVAR